MKKVYLQRTLFFVVIILLVSCNVNIEKDITEDAAETSVIKGDYDSVAATKYGADQYGMKKYVMAFLKRGPNRNFDPDSAAALQKAHLENIGKMADAGQLILAGPFFGNDDLRGIYIFNVESIEAAEALTNTDPAIKAGSLVMELKEWYGSAALMAVNDLHKTLEKKNVAE